MSGGGEYLFVYGSLREALQHPLQRVLQRGGEHLGEARFQGVLYAVDWYPGAVPSPEPGDSVLGDLYRLHAAQTVLAQLDTYERCTPSDPPPTLFRRGRFEVRRVDGTSCPAWVYVYNHPVSGLRRIASGDFLHPGTAGLSLHPGLRP